MSALLEQKLKHEFNWCRKELFRQGMSTWIQENDCDYFVTLTFKNNKITKEAALRALRLFDMKINRSLYGNRPKTKLVMFPFIERNSFEGFHFHIFVTIPSDLEVNEIKQRIKSIWCSLEESGRGCFHAKNNNQNEKWFVPIYDVNELSKYVLKQSSNIKIDNLVVELISK